VRVAAAGFFVALAVALPSASVAEQPIQVFLLAGQSNMLGRGQPVSDGTGSTANLLLFRDGVWQQAADPLGPTGDPDNGVGPGMTFGLGVLANEPPGTTVGLIMCAQSATPIKAWTPNKYAYTSCKKAARAAGGVVAGIVFLQGEFEARTGGSKRWARGFADSERAFEKDFGPVPFVLGQIGNIERPYAQSVRDAQAAADATFAQVTLVSSLDLPLSDGIHFTVDADKTLGYRFADAWYSLLQEFPQVTGVSPLEALPGTAVTITGSAFNDVAQVTFGSTEASYTVDSPEQITAIVPNDAVTGPVRVTTPYGRVAGPSVDVLPLIDAFSPTSGSQGVRVIVTGKALSQTTAVTLDGLPATFRVLSATQLRIWVPTGGTSGKIAVTTAGGTTESADTFTVVP
jgi:hypothetical protein